MRWVLCRWLSCHADYAVPDTYPLFTACRTHGFAANRGPGTGCCTGSAKTRRVSRPCGGAGPMNQIASRGQLRMSYLRWELFTVRLILLLGIASGRIAGKIGRAHV